MFAFQDVPGRGKGLIAVENIPKGTRILSEKPVVTIPEYKHDEKWIKKHIEQQVMSLTEDERQSFLSLCNIYPYQNVLEQYIGIYRTNGLPIEANGIQGGVFLNACRINHTCDNNAQKHWNRLSKRHTVHALRNIPKGEEITIYYLARDSSRAIRQRRLKEKFGFLCSCHRCSLPAEESEALDKRLERISELDDLVGYDGSRMNFSLQTLRYVDEQVRLYNEQREGDSGLSRAYFDAAQIVIANGDLARGRIFAERAVEGWRTAQGSDSEEVIKHGVIAKNPSKLQIYGISMRWKTSAHEIPEGLNQVDFEDWLWRREKPIKHKSLEQLTSLRNREIFPAFADLPQAKSDSRFYEEVNGAWKPLRYWCFLGEIVGHTTLHHLEFELKDVNDKRMPLHFNTPGLGSEVSNEQIRIGYTVAVSYATYHVFVYGKPGIRHEEPDLLKVHPFTLQ